MCVFFFCQFDRPTQYQETHSTLNEGKKGGPKGENITKLRIPALALVRANGEGLELEASAS